MADLRPQKESEEHEKTPLPLGLPSLPGMPALPSPAEAKERFHASIPTSRVKQIEYLFAAMFVLGLLFLGASFLAFYGPPRNFPTATVVTIPQGVTLREASELLEGAGAVRSAFWFQSIVRIISGETSVVAGDYYFTSPVSSVEVARRITTGRYGLDPQRVTIPEGATSYEIAAILDQRFGKFDAEKFIALASEDEGYLFPDTYFFLPNLTAEDAIVTMERNFSEKIQSLSAEITAYGKPLHEVLTMASILEKEARTPESRRTIAGILWRRIQIGMPLQVDATFLYINGKNTYQLTHADLKEDDPYNTYTNKGLPPGPIANPGIDSIKAAIEPVKTRYLFYLSDRSGNLYYSKTFDQHKAYKDRYVN